MTGKTQSVSNWKLVPGVSYAMSSPFTVIDKRSNFHKSFFFIRILIYFHRNPEVNKCSFLLTQKEQTNPDRIVTFWFYSNYMKCSDVQLLFVHRKRPWPQISKWTVNESMSRWINDIKKDLSFPLRFFFTICNTVHCQKTNIFPFLVALSVWIFSKIDAHIAQSGWMYWQVDSSL